MSDYNIEINGAQETEQISAILQSKLRTKVKSDIYIDLQIDSSIAAESYIIINNGNSSFHISGGDFCGVLYGAGTFIRTLKYDNDTISCFTGSDAPVNPLRGMYFASHFYNFYQNAPSELLDDYITELALWGCNVLTFWFDMHHYQGIDDPKAVEDIERLKKISHCAGRLGIKTGLTMLANEAYDSSPEELRADWTSGHDGYFANPGGHYHREICPEIPGGMDYILKTRREVLSAFADLPVEYVCIWPYDQGGCTCSKCTPWGANGFLKTAEPLADLCREIFPEVKIILSTWYFDCFIKDEWKAFDEIISADKPEWIDYLLCDGWGGFPEYILKNGIPGDYPVVSFPEISMEQMFPWGGFGANPRPQHLENYFNTAKSFLKGSFPYSEGIFEDLNKYICIRKHWNPDIPASAIVHEYAATELSAEYANDITRLIYMLENTLDYHSVLDRHPDRITYNVTDKLNVLAGKIANLAEKIDSGLTEKVRKSWRWRILYLRALIDAELVKTEGRPNETTENYFNELSAIYHVNSNSTFAIAPPNRKNLSNLEVKKHNI